MSQACSNDQREQRDDERDAERRCDVEFRCPVVTETKCSMHLPHGSLLSQQGLTLNFDPHFDYAAACIPTKGLEADTFVLGVPSPRRGDARGAHETNEKS